MSTVSVTRSLLLFAAASVLAYAMTFASCGPSASSEEHPDLAGYTLPTAAPDATYTVRGRVAELPVQGKPNSSFRVRHEAIADFKNKSGVVEGMPIMTMHFPPGKGVDIRSLKVGDAVRITFSVWWKSTPTYAITKVEPLPAGEVLTIDGP